MPYEQIVKVVGGTADAAFAIDAFGLITAWNKAAEELFGLSSAEAIGRACHEIIEGADESGVVCSEHCSVQQEVRKDCPVQNFDVQIQTKRGREWCNVSILIVTDQPSGLRHAVHIVRPREMRKRLEQLVRDFVVKEAGSDPDATTQSISSGTTAVANVELTTREKELLQLLAIGSSSKEIAQHLDISPATVNNHIKHILTKFDAHSRLEVVHRARAAGLI
jgi:PAS domain S-box-containing protein